MERSDWMSFPLATNLEGDILRIVLPLTEPEEQSTKNALGTLMTLAVCEGYKISFVACKDTDNEKDFYSIFDPMAQRFLGAVTVLRRRKFTLNINPAAAHRPGVEFVTHYAVSRYYNLGITHDSWKGTKWKSLSQNLTGSVWGKKATLAITNRVNGLIRQLVDRFCLAEDFFEVPMSYLKSKAYHLAKRIGAKPVTALFTEREAAILEKRYNFRCNHFDNSWQQILNFTVTDAHGPKVLDTALADLTPPKDARVNSIREFGNYRNNKLMITTGFGRKQVKSLQKGSTLREKLQKMDGGYYPLYVPDVMHSHLHECTRSQWNQCIQRIYRYLNGQQLSPTGDNVENAVLQWPELSKTNVQSNMADVIVTLELLQEAHIANRGDKVWEGAYGIYSQ
jgi:hypothetical protein